MSIRAIVKNGTIQPLQPLPDGWSEGKELLIDELDDALNPREAEEWVRDMEEGARDISPDEHERFLQAVAEVERESKEAVRRAWGLP